MLRTLRLYSYEAYLDAEYRNLRPNTSIEDRADDEELRILRLSRFPFPVMLEVAFFHWGELYPKARA